MSALKSMFRLFLFVLSISSILTAEVRAADAAADEAAIREFLERLEAAFAAGDVEGAVAAFTNDAIVFPNHDADMNGIAAIRAGYTGLLTQFNVELSFDTREIAVAGDAAYESGYFTLKLTDKASGTVVSNETNRHIHILTRQSDGAWKTWRMMVNSATSAPAP